MGHSYYSTHTTGFGKPSVYHAAIIIFLEFFSWGLLTSPLMKLFGGTFHESTLLMNGMIQGIKGILSFLSSPLLGSLSDSWGRRPFLLLTVFCTCIPIPVMLLNAEFYFAVFTLSGLFSVTYSIVFAYVADISSKEERSSAYGIVSATFAASLIISPSLGTYISDLYGDYVVIIIATAISFLDVLFILVVVPESLSSDLCTEVSWQKADPFASLRAVAKDPTLLYMCVIVFLSYLPEAGEYSCIFLYLRRIIGLSPKTVAALIGVTGILSVLAQTWVLTFLTKSFGINHSIVIGMICQIIQLLLYGLAKSHGIMWIASGFAAISSITYPAINAIISVKADRAKQGVVQGMVTGVRGLCNGFGPAFFGIIFYAFNVNISLKHDKPIKPTINGTFNASTVTPLAQNSMSGPPFVFGALLVLIALVLIIRRNKRTKVVQLL